MALAEQFVLEAEQLATFDGEMPTPQQPHRAATRGPVERFGHRRPPVDHHGLAILVGDGEAADVEALDGFGRLGRPIDATEHQRRVAQVEVGETLEQRFVEGVALEPGLERTAEIGLGHVPHTPRGLATGVETLVRVVDVGLFVSEIGVLLGHNGSRNAIGQAPGPDPAIASCVDGCPRRPRRSARVPGGARRGFDPRCDQTARPRRRDHHAAGSPLRRRRRCALQRHRGRPPRSRFRCRRRSGYRPGRRATVALTRRPPTPAPTRLRRHLLRHRHRRPTRRRTRGAAARVRRCPVHRGELSDRGPPEQGLPPHQGADPHRRSPVARGDGTPRRVGHHVHRRATQPWRHRVPAVRLVGGLAEPPRLRPLRPAPLAPRVARTAPPPPECPGDPFRHRLRPPSRIDARRRTDRARPRLAHSHRRCSSPLRRRSDRAGQPRPRPRVGRGRAGSRRCPPGVARQRAARRHPAPGPRLQPRPRSTTRHRSSRAPGRGRPGPRTHPTTSRRDHPPMTSDRVAVVLMAYGTPRTPDEIEPYYTDIRRGRPPTPEALADLVARYAAIGGVSPMAQLTEAQASGLQSALDAAEPGRFEVSLGLKHADPKVEETAQRVAADGVCAVVGLVLAPHYSSYSIGQYLDRTRQGVAESGADIEVVGVESWATEPAFIDFLADDLDRRVTAMRERTGGRVRVLFTAHSLPQRIIDDGDPYPDELRATAEAVAARLGLTEGDDWQIAWQSAGRTPEPWIGPDILEVIDGLGRTATENADDAVAGVIVSACGFVADHLEVLFDLDIEAAQRAGQHGLAFDRTACVNDHPAIMAALADRVLSAVDATR